MALTPWPYGSWRAVAIRPSQTAMPVDPDGFASFNESPSTPQAVSPGLLFASGATTFTDPNLHPHAQSVTGLARHVFGGANLIPDPAYTGAANPFPSDSGGVPTVGGKHLTYRTWVICDQLQYIWNGTEWVVPNYPAPNGLPLKLTGRVRLDITVQDPGTDQAEVSSVVVRDRFEPFVDAAGLLIMGLEPTVALDGHLIIVQSQKHNPNTGGELIAYINPVAGATTGWLGPVWVHELYDFRNVVTLDGRSIGERYPFTRQPVRLPDGSPLPSSQPYRGGYPWLSWDGRFLMHTTYIAGVPTGHPDLQGIKGDRSNRGGVSVVGSLTGGQIWHMDGAVNPNRYAWTFEADPSSGSPPQWGMNSSARLRLQCFGFAPGFWNLYRDHGAFPARPDHEFAFFPFVPSINTATELSFEAWTDGNYSVFLPMNELLQR
ncbi:MAG: hypothetical protein AAFZ65_04280, partial [Planctomycetota bacterium]